MLRPKRQLYGCRLDFRPEFVAENQADFHGLPFSSPAIRFLIPFIRELDLFVSHCVALTSGHKPIFQGITVNGWQGLGIR